jgi:transposase
MMRFYDQKHRFYAGVDLHSRKMYVAIHHHDGQVVFEKNLSAERKTFLRAIAPYRDDLVVGAESMFSWYWLADLAADENINFQLGHALYMKAIHGGKTKNDRIDANKIARLLRNGGFPLSYVYPKGMRETRDLLRRRMMLVRRRAELFTHLQIVNLQYNLPPFAKAVSCPGNRKELDLVKHFPDACVQKNISLDLSLIERYDELIADVELCLVRTVKAEDAQSYYLLQTVPGIGKVLALVLLYELHDIKRFATVGQFLSYARLVRCTHESAGKKLGTGGKKIGNAYLKWAFSEAVVGLLRNCPDVKAWYQRQEKKRGSRRALSLLAARLGRSVYHMLRKNLAFDRQRFLGS